MKNVVIAFIASFLLFSCSQNTSVNSIDNNYSYQIKSSAGAIVIAITNNNAELITACNSNGDAVIKSEEPLNKVCCVVTGKSGIVDVGNEMNLFAQLSEISKEKGLAKTTTTGTFGACSTDTHGDAIFRYTGTFQQYYCTSWLPYLGESTNPNKWGGWDLTEWLPTWKGKKLLIPTRYQLYHKTAYGYSISSALFLVSNY